MVQLFLQVGSLNRYPWYFDFYILVLLVLPRQLTITVNQSSSVNISGFVWVRHGKFREQNPHVNDLHSFKSFSIV